jgi:hypothetical protein
MDTEQKERWEMFQELTLDECIEDIKRNSIRQP